MKKTFITDSFEKTQNIGQKIAAELKGGEILALFGNLGSGKTTFTQGLAKGLGITKKITSPTFTILHSHIIPSINLPPLLKGDRGISPQYYFYHIDLYRINNENDVNDLGLIEIINDPQNIVVIEWPEKIKKILPDNIIKIYFEYLDENKRKITF